MLIFGPTPQNYFLFLLLAWIIRGLVAVPWIRLGGGVGRLTTKKSSSDPGLVNAQGHYSKSKRGGGKKILLTKKKFGNGLKRPKKQ